MRATSDFCEWNPARRTLLLGAAIYLGTTAILFAAADRAILAQHTPFNHFALQAEAWLDGRLHLSGPPPLYTGNNDFAHFGGKWYVVFPSFPAVLLLPFVALEGGAIGVRDGQVFLWLAGIAPAVLFLALDKLCALGRSSRSTVDNVLLALLFAFGTVYFFTAEQGTVWYAAHVVGATLTAFYLLFALDAERPVLAGLMIGLGVHTRAPILLAFPLFVGEALRVTSGMHRAAAELTPKDEPAWASICTKIRNTDWPRLLSLLARFSAPVLAAVAIALWHNEVRFGRPLDFGYVHLQVAWQERMLKWGLFHYHYLGRNLGVILTSVPYLSPPQGSHSPAFQINGHGLALWVTSPFLVWLLWPRRTKALHWSLWLTVAAVALPNLLYQNTGWVQFGYRFSNDFAVFLFALLALGGRRLGMLFWAAGVWSLAVNAFGAISFNRHPYAEYYYIDNTQRVLHQPD